MHTCLNCNSPESERPLVVLQYRNSQQYICNQCFPLLIHSPEKLAGSLQGAEKLKGAEHEH